MHRRQFLGLLPTAMLFATGHARATVYLSLDDAKRTLFPEATGFVDRSLTLSRDQARKIAKASSTRVKFPDVIAFEVYNDGKNLGTLFIDKVFGKHEFITYALALDDAGAVTGIEVMEYLESYGDEIMNARWREQFSGRRYGQPLRIDKEVKNISGATLSCVHITKGVRRLLTTYALVFASV